MQFFTDFLSKKFIFFDVLKTEPVHPYTQVFMVLRVAYWEDSDTAGFILGRLVLKALYKIPS